MRLQCSRMSNVHINYQGGETGVKQGIDETMCNCKLIKVPLLFARTKGRLSHDANLYYPGS